MKYWSVIAYEEAIVDWTEDGQRQRQWFSRFALTCRDVRFLSFDLSSVETEMKIIIKMKQCHVLFFFTRVAYTKVSPHEHVGYDMYFIVENWISVAHVRLNTANQNAACGPPWHAWPDHTGRELPATARRPSVRLVAHPSRNHDIRETIVPRCFTKGSAVAAGLKLSP